MIAAMLLPMLPYAFIFFFRRHARLCRRWLFFASYASRHFLAFRFRHFLASRPLRRCFRAAAFAACHADFFVITFAARCR